MLPCTGQLAPVSAIRAGCSQDASCSLLLCDPQLNVDGQSPGSIYLQLQSPCNTGTYSPYSSFARGTDKRTAVTNMNASNCRWCVPFPASPVLIMIVSNPRVHTVIL